eukprot:s66_g30.t1
MIAVAEVDRNLLVAVPESAWSKTPARRLLPARALSKPILCSVAGCAPEQRDLVGFGGRDLKVWFGLIHPSLESQIDDVSEEEIGYHFYLDGEDEILPYGPALVEVSQAHFAFVTAGEELPAEVPVCPPLQE